MGLEKAKIKNLETGYELSCLFNPTEYTIAKTNSWGRGKTKGKNMPELEFNGGEPQTMSLELFFDTFEDGGDVRAYTAQLFQLTMIVQDKPPKNKKTQQSRPPLCLFTWGPYSGFKAAVSSLSVRYTLFRNDGTPVRATASVTLTQAEDEHLIKGQVPDSFPAPANKRREVRPRETLSQIAHEEYGDATRWRDIARANNVTDPLSLRPGQVLTVPPLS